jgi:uncharacterized protein
MDNYQPEEVKLKESLPRSQKILLAVLMIGYPALSILMNWLGSGADKQIVSKITQIYLPSMAIQLLLLFVIIYVVYFSGSKLAEIGLAREDVTWSNALSGLIFFVGAWIFIIIIRGAVVKSGYIPEKEYLYLLPSTIAQKSFWILLSLTAAFSEEMTFRGFIMTRFKILTNSYWPGVILSSAAFSLGHLYQGPAGVVLTFVYGMLFAGLFVARGSIFPCVVAHFLQDVLIVMVV